MSFSVMRHEQSSRGQEAHREVCRVREQDSPAVVDPLMPVHGTHGGLGLEIWHDVAEAEYLHTRFT